MKNKISTLLSASLLAVLAILPFYGTWKMVTPVVMKSAIDGNRGNLQAICKQIKGCQRATASVFWNSGRQRYEVVTNVVVTRKTPLEARQAMSEQLRQHLADVPTPLNLYRPNMGAIVVMFDYA